MLPSGTRLGPYEILAPLGAGGMGEVYRARDARLRRSVAVKVLPEALCSKPEALARFESEALAVAALSHPNILSIFDVGEEGGVRYVVTELLEGETLRSLLSRGPIPLGRALEIAHELSDALAAAHEKGVLHRDVKPENVFLTRDGHAKLLDFGLARHEAVARGPGDSPAPTVAKAALTRTGTVVGTVPYMAPEQVRGQAVDHRADLFSLGCVLHEMLTGRAPFRRETDADTMSAILHEEPPPLPASVPRGLGRAVRRCLEKSADARFQSARDLGFVLKAEPVEPGASPGPARPGSPGSRPISRWLELAKAPFTLLFGGLRGFILSRRLASVLVAASLLAAALLGRSWYRASRVHWARDVATREVKRLVAAEEYAPAVALARRAIEVLPGDPELRALLDDATVDATVESDPPGAEVSYRPYRGGPGVWERVGVTPFQKVPVPRGWYVWRATRPGFRPGYVIAPTLTISISFRFPVLLRFPLDPEGSLPVDVVRIPGGAMPLWSPGLEHLSPVTLDDYLIGRCEVTNEEFRRFVDAGGYTAREFWKEPFVRDGQSVPWAEAMTVFLDTTGRPGPSTWELGTFPKGEERHPVSGVSWYEAAAYAAFAGRTLPTIYHWNYAAQAQASHLVVPGSNFKGNGTFPVGGATALGGFGTYDMAGNVKEWCWNEGGGGKRYILGGGFGEPGYMFVYPDTQSPWDRRPNYGFRTVQLSKPPPPAAVTKIEEPHRDLSTEKPASDEAFRAFRGLYRYDRGDLDVRVEETATTEDGTVQRVSFRAAYGNERVNARLFLPKGVAPPYQVVVYFPGAAAIMVDKFDLGPYCDFFQRSGRALLYPTYKGTFERRDGLKNSFPNQTAFYRDHMIAWSKDLGRSLDYLATRSDIDPARMAYVGMSWGGAVAPVLLAVESRFRVAILVSASLKPQRALPEAEPLHFAPRVTLPLLMLNGRHDHLSPLESSQLPLLRLLGTPAADKKHVIFESGHSPPRKEVIRESLDWLDRYLGPVNREPGR